MKESGVDWLGLIPDTWKVSRGRHLFEIRKRVIGELGHPVISVTQTGLHVKDIETGEGQLSQDYSKYQVLKRGEFAMNSMDLLTGGVGISEIDGVTSPDYRVFSIRDSHKNNDCYMLYVMRMLYQNRGFYAWGQGSSQLGRWRLPRRRFNEFPFPVPPRDEQDIIVAYLDRKLEKIDRYISNRRRLIELLKEQKQAIIHRAVTRGLYLNIRLRPSGIDWIDVIPEHWDVTALRRISRRYAGGTPSKVISAYWQQGRIPWLNSGSVNQGVIVAPSEYITDEGLRSSSARWIPKGALVLSLAGQGRTKGMVAQLGIDATCNQSMCAICPGDQINNRFLRWWLTSNYRNIRSMASDDLRDGLNLEMVGSIPCLIPPIEEQERIIQSLEGPIQSAELACSRLQETIEVLQEYHASLITQAVTGKITLSEMCEVVERKAIHGRLEVVDSEGKQKPKGSQRRANVHFQRCVFATEIAHRLHTEPTFGRVKFEKLIFLCEKRCGVDTGSTYHRQAAGPYDNRALRSIDSQMKKQAWYQASKVEGRYKYVPLSKAGNHLIYFDRYFGSVEAEFTSVIEMFRKSRTERCEIVATLYSAWEDLLSEGMSVTEDSILDQVLNHWHDSKRRIPRSKWVTALQWMSQSGLRPGGAR